MSFFIKVFVTALIVAGTVELSKRSSLLAAILISLPISSVLALSWMHSEGRDTKAIADMSLSIFWVVLPSLVFFLALSFLLNKAVTYWVALGSACVVTMLAYFSFVKIAAFFGLNL